MHLLNVFSDIYYICHWSISTITHQIFKYIDFGIITLILLIIIYRNLSNNMLSGMVPEKLLEKSAERTLILRYQDLKNFHKIIFSNPSLNYYQLLDLLYVCIILVSMETQIFASTQISAERQKPRNQQKL